MRFLRTVLGSSDSGLRAIGRRYFEEYAKRKRNEAEYRTVINNLTAQSGIHLYDDMVLDDGVKPKRETGVLGFDQYRSSGKSVDVDLFVTVIEGAMTGHTPKGMHIACDKLVEMLKEGFWLNEDKFNDLLLMASADKATGKAFAYLNPLLNDIEATEDPSPISAGKSHGDGRVGRPGAGLRQVNFGFAFRAMEQRCFAGSMDSYAKRNYATLFAGHTGVALRAIGRRYFARSAEECTDEFITVTKANAPHLLRDLYHDTVLKKGVKPDMRTFRSLFIGTMKGSLLQDAIFFKEEMNKMGFVPDVDIFNLLISTCMKCHDSDGASRIWDEMKNYQVTPIYQTYVCLLNGFAADGRIDRAYEVVRYMNAVGLTLDQFCYAGLIAAHKNEMPLPSNVHSIIIQLVKQSKGSYIIGENVMEYISIEEFYNLPTAHYVHRAAGILLDRSLTVYYMAFHAFADLKAVEAMEELNEVLLCDGKNPDDYILKEVMRCYLNAQNLERGLEVFENYTNSKKFVDKDFFVTLMKGAMIGYTPRGMQIAYNTLLKMLTRNIWLNAKEFNDLLQVASGESMDSGDYTMANLLWDTIRINKLSLQYFPTEAYYQGLRFRKIPDNGERLAEAKEIRDRLRGDQLWKLKRKQARQP